MLDVDDFEFYRLRLFIVVIVVRLTFLVVCVAVADIKLVLLILVLLSLPSAGWCRRWCSLLRRERLWLLVGLLCWSAFLQRLRLT